MEQLCFNFDKKIYLKKDTCYFLLPLFIFLKDFFSCRTSVHRGREIFRIKTSSLGFPGAPVVGSPPTMEGTQFRSLVQN